MPAIYEISLPVRIDDIDAQGHVSNLRYVQWMLRLAVSHSDAQGWSADRYREHAVSWVVRTHHIDYLKPAFAGDAILARTWVATMSKAASLRQYRFHRSDGELLVRAETNWAFVDNRRLAPCRIPPEVRAAFEIVGEEPDGRV